jgi:choline dehydrogenase-like flavoprotein
MDTTALVYGVTSDTGAGFDPPMTWSYEDAELGVMYSTLVDPWLSYPIALLRSEPVRALTWHRWRNTLGVMIKLTDEVSGGIDERGRVNKGLTGRDDARLARAREIARSILERAGCDRDDTFEPPLRGTHPCATVRIGESLSTDLETRIAGLYVCDASVFPQALGRPTVLTILALAHRLADYLLTRR